MFKLAILADISSPHTIKWLNALSNNNIEILLISLGNKEVNLNISNVSILSFNKTNKQDNFIKRIKLKFDYIKYVLSIKRKIRAFNPDILHSHYATSYGLLGSLMNIKPYVISVWGSDVTSFPKKSFLHKILIKYNFSKANYICATGNSLKKETIIYTSKNVHVIPFGIDVSRFSPRMKELSKQVTIGSVKYFDKIYGLDILIKAFSLLVKDKRLNVDIKLLLIGDGEEKQNYIDMINSEGISERVEFAGFINNDLLLEEYHKMDIVVIPSLRESFGLSVLEAMSCEIPVIASNISGFREVGNDETITYFDAGNIEMLAKNIFDVINAYDLALVKAKKARQRVIDNFSSDYCVNMQMNLYKQILK